ncbi:hypothetical protein BACCIP111883_04113 [Sutcliffiella rhizosphaerae]|uniref:Uncharacterized protein n=1 Tax=Sutcliffiella rhizosphaerae TaxID=2880967 RepID=A0ABN8AGR5_9BACI|nr:hypothetical protein BACCIP111883_04113 [Sutcliffiella rhizosphaerae]
MNIMAIGLIFISTGITLLMLSLTVTMPTALMAVSLGTSFLMNMVGTGIILQKELLDRLNQRLFCKIIQDHTSSSLGNNIVS